MTRAPSRRLLLVEDDPGDVDLVGAYLEESGAEWEMDVADDLDAARRALAGEAYDLVLTDLGLPDSRGIDSFLHVREAAGSTPVVVLTGLADTDLGRLAVSKGAQDYLVKGDLSPALLSRALEYAVERARMAAEAERRETIARRADRLAVVGRLVGGVAHEFNNLLTAIQGYAQILDGDPGLDEDQRESVGEILLAAKRASGITRQLLAYSRRQVLSPAAFDLDACLREMQALFESTLGRRFVLSFDLGVPVPVHADRSQVEHAVLHLVANVRDALPDGGTVEISTESRYVDGDGPAGLEPGEYVVLEVRDDGPGMPPEVLERAREPFFTTRQFGEALGLGLATVDGIAAQSGGALTLESAPGEGTTARVYLPPAEEGGGSPRRGRYPPPGSQPGGASSNPS